MEESSRHRPNTEKEREYDRQLFLLSFLYLQRLPSFSLYVYVVVCLRLARSFLYEAMCVSFHCCYCRRSSLAYSHVLYEKEKRRRRKNLDVFFHQSIVLMLVDNDDVTRTEDGKQKIFSL